ncbi:MAG: D-aminoacylase [Cytophagales bacterium]|nr:MAG: D-aminoacylase [Cytophagales bacterium]
MHKTTLIKNGIYYDGTGAKGQKADVLIRNGKIEKVGNINETITDAEIIDANNCWVTPGFLDIHTHYDAEVEVLPGLDESVRHGVTTVVFGNCSLSSAVGTEDDILNLFTRVENMPADLLQSWIKDKITWKTTAQYYEHLDTLALGPNVATFIGHSNIRIASMGLDRSLTVAKASTDELNKMRKTVEEAMEAGYLGLSIDMLPFHRMAKGEHKGISVPSQQAHPTEYYRLANIVRRYERVLQATPNAVDKRSVIRLLGMSSGWLRKPLKTTIVAAMDVKSDKKIHLLATTLAGFANSVMRANIRWQALAEPFLNFADGPITPLFEEFPSAVKAIGATTEERKAMFADKTFRAWFRKDWHNPHTAVFPRKLDDMWVVNSPDTTQIGKSIAEIAKEKNQDPLEHFMDLLAQYDTDFRWKCAVANHRPKQRLRLLAHPTTIPGFNDSGAHNTNMAFQDGSLQTLKQAQANPDVFPIETAIYRMTKMAADWLGFDAGSICEGDRADLVIIDPSKLQTHLGEPIEYIDERLGNTMRMVKRSDGVVKQVFISGEKVFDNGQFHEQLGKKKIGKLLRAKNQK